MRLESIKLVGFKSFVDPTKVDFPSNLNGVVGPNGCGKSNIIDAVRWVMGESSAKQLRGESSTDVIFNGTVERKPVGQASIELVFDNSEGKLGGEYAKYNQISVKRQVNREAQSTYYLNGTKCRRRDITDVFLGTGMGPRSYAIIEQGMISRLIEAKPEEMRANLEEVSGISKYKERRRETENRIKHTRENLSRLHDLREEIEKQLATLKRQSSAAERYRVLKEEARQLQAQVYGVQWKNLAADSKRFRESLDELSIKLEEEKANFQAEERKLVELREEKNQRLDTFNEVQKNYYDCGSEISRLEQAIKHQKERREQLEKDLENAEKEYRHLQNLVEQDLSRQTALQGESEQLRHDIVEKREIFEACGEKMQATDGEGQAWQENWDVFNQRAAETSRKAQVEQTRIQHIEQRQLQQKQRMDRIAEEERLLRQDSSEDELKSLSGLLDDLHNEAQMNEAQYQTLLSDLNAQREQERTHRDRLDSLRGEWQSLKAKIASLETLQQDALMQKGEKIKAWMSAQGLSDKPLLAQCLETRSGWEKAVEMALGSLLEAVCVDNPANLKSALADVQEGQLNFFRLTDTQDIAVSPDSLASKINAPKGLRAELAHVFTAENLDEALSRLPSLQAHQAVVTRDGMYLTPNLLRIDRGRADQQGVLEREKTIKQYKEDSERLARQVAELENTLSNSEASLKAYEEQRDSLQAGVSQAKSNLADTKAKVEVKRSKLEHAELRLKALAEELLELKQQFAKEHNELAQARAIWQEAMQAMEHDATDRDRLLAERDRFKEALSLIRAEYQEAQSILHRAQTSLESKETESQALTQSIERMRAQMQQMQERKAQYELALQSDDSPEEDLSEKLASAVSRHATIEKELTDEKQIMGEIEHKIFEAEKARHAIDESINTVRSKLENQKLRIQEFDIRQANIVERLKEDDLTLEVVLAELTDEHEEKALLEALEATQRRIERLGPINLAAIDEYKVQEERKIYIDKQYEDLEKALSTLENAIRKIDRETRQRFKETFDTVNGYFKEFFPKIFGGGSAYMELIGDDLLSAGVTVMARPPGKKNTSIHLLSGGEKALTAVALVFSMFQLNPAPFCMLDEVDAPLDDNNVLRFCKLVKEMSDKVQFIFISHNKLAIEMAHNLIGVTMHEPGVSRIVSVDMDEAVAMAEA